MDPEIPEGINVSKTHPLADFGLMLAGAVGMVVLVLVLAQILAGVLVQFISFETEARLFEQSSFDGMFEDQEEHQEQTRYLQSLTDRLSAHMDLPENMVIRAHYSAEDVPNAFATLGGNILIYQGLIDRVSSENGLAMVVAHEIAHIKHRDPIMALGRGTVSAIGLIAITGFSDSNVMGNIAGITSAGFLSKFSRDQETTADTEAVASVLAEYGSLHGADEFFSEMLQEEFLIEPVFFSTHPPTDERIKRIKSESKADSDKSTEGLTTIPLVPLPEIFSKDLETVEN